MMVNKWIEQCVIVDGRLRSAIYDLNRNQIHLADPKIKALRKKLEGKSTNELHQELEEGEMGWFQHLQKLEVLMEVPSTCFDHFPPLPIRFDSPKIIQTASIHAGNDIDACLDLLHALNCFHLTLVVEHDEDLPDLLEAHFSQTDLRSLEIFVKETSRSQAEYDQLIADFQVIQKVHTSRPFEAQQDAENCYVPVLELSIMGFMEAQAHHLYFNQRLHIDAEGFFHNAPNTPASALHIDEVKVETAASQILSDMQVTKYWKAGKDMTDVCCACEFRYQCHDHREPEFRSSDGLWFHTSKCAYNPYIGKWRGQKGYLPLQACGVHSDSEGFWIDADQLEASLERAWLQKPERSPVL